MIILSHRGYWIEPKEKNMMPAFHRAFEYGFGVETDIRDNNTSLIISHDIEFTDILTLEEMLILYNSTGCKLPLALNIKSDGLQIMLNEIINRFSITNYFVFDMSIPDALGYLKNGMNIFTRQSEYEQIPSLYSDAYGVWMDEFNDHWIKEDHIEGHLREGKKVAIVSPELHGRAYLDEWSHYREIELKLGVSDLILCTDYPEIARQFFKL